jgi:hypothetical protein
MSDGDKPKKKAIASNWIDDAVRLLRIPVEEIKKYRSDKPLRRPDPPKPPPGEGGPES